MSGTKWIVGICAVCLALAGPAAAHNGDVLEIPKLPGNLVPAIDGDPSDWMDFGLSEGVWDWERVQGGKSFGDNNHFNAPEEGEPEGSGGTAADFSVEIFRAYDDNWIYLACVVNDNVWDVHSNPESFAHADIFNIQIDTDHDAVVDDGMMSWYWKSDAENVLEANVREINWFPDGMSIHIFGHEETGTLHQTMVGGGPYDANWVIEVAISMAELTEWNPRWLAPYEGKIIGWQYKIYDGDGGGGKRNAKFVLYGNDGNVGELFGDMVFVDPIGVAVETANWGQIKQLFE